MPAHHCDANARAYDHAVFAIDVAELGEACADFFCNAHCGASIAGMQKHRKFVTTQSGNDITFSHGFMQPELAQCGIGANSLSPAAHRTNMGIAV